MSTSVSRGRRSKSPKSPACHQKSYGDRPGDTPLTRHRASDAVPGAISISRNIYIWTPRGGGERRDICTYRGEFRYRYSKSPSFLGLGDPAGGFI